MQDSPFMQVTPIKNLTEGKPLPKDMLEDYLDEPDKVPEGLQHWQIMSAREKWHQRVRRVTLLLAGMQLAWVPWTYVIIATISLAALVLLVCWFKLRHFNEQADNSAAQAEQRLQKMIKPVPHVHEQKA